MFWTLGFGVDDWGCGCICRVSGFGFCVLGFGFWVLGLGCVDLHAFELRSKTARVDSHLSPKPNARAKNIRASNPEICSSPETLNPEP
jgi:hypothetical protein